MAELKLVTKDGLLYYHQKLKAALNTKVDKKEGYSLLSDSEIARLLTLENFDDSEIQATLQDFTQRIEALEGEETDIEGTLESIRSDITALQESLKKHTEDTTVHIKAEERTKWDNAIQSVKVNGEALVPDESRAVDIDMPTDVSDLGNSLKYQTEGEVDTAIKAAIGKFAQGAYKKLNDGEYDETGTPTIEGEPGIIYLVPKDGNEKNNVYTEWILAEGGFEKIGDTKIDLSNYATKDDIITNEDIDAIWASV